MDKEEVNATLAKTKWHIDLGWFEQNKRSFNFLAQNSLCSKCRKKLKADENEVSAEEIMSRIQDCCSKSGEFISRQLPLLESAFRFLLAHGNQPIELEELGKQLNDLRGGDASRTAPQILYLLLKNDRFYGFQEVPPG